MEEIAHLIQKYGYLFYGITFLWTFLEGETFVIFAGALAVPGLGGATTPPPINIYYLIAAAWIGSFCGDQLYFFLGRKFGARARGRQLDSCLLQRAGRPCHRLPLTFTDQAAGAGHTALKPGPYGVEQRGDPVAGEP